MTMVSKEGMFIMWIPQGDLALLHIEPDQMVLADVQTYPHVPKLHQQPDKLRQIFKIECLISNTKPLQRKENSSNQIYNIIMTGSMENQVVK